MKWQDFKDVQIGDELIITENPQTYSISTKGKDGRRKVTYPYTLIVTDIMDKVYFLSLRDSNGYGWSINNRNVDYWQKVHKKPSKVKDKIMTFKEHDIIISLKEVGKYRKKGSIFKLLEKTTTNDIHYSRDGTTSSDINSWRHADEEEVNYYNWLVEKYGKHPSANINDIEFQKFKSQNKRVPEVGDWVKILKKGKGFIPIMDYLIGNSYQINRIGTNDFKIIDKKNNAYWHISIDDDCWEFCEKPLELPESYMVKMDDSPENDLFKKWYNKYYEESLSLTVFKYYGSYRNQMDYFDTLPDNVPVFTPKEFLTKYLPHLLSKPISNLYDEFDFPEIESSIQLKSKPKSKRLFSKPVCTYVSNINRKGQQFKF